MASSRDLERRFVAYAQDTFDSTVELAIGSIMLAAEAHGVSDARARALIERLRKTEKPPETQGLPRLEPVEAFMAKEFPPASWIVPELIPANTIGTIAGPSFTGKTLVAIHAAVEAARAGARVAYVLEEGTGDDFQGRLRAAGWAPGMALDVMFQCGARLDDAEWVAHWREILRGYDVAFFDTFSDVTGVDQLEPRAMLAVFKAVRGIRVDTGCSMVLLMHSPKAVFRGDTPPSLADVFGSVVAVNAMDFVHLIRAMKEDDEDVEGKVEVHCRKLRSAGSAPPGPRAGEIVQHELPGGQTTVSFRFIEGASPRDAKLQARTEKYRGRVLDFVREHRVASANAVCEGLGGKTQYVKQAVKDLLSIGSITMGSTGFWEVVPTGSLVVPTDAGNQGRHGSPLVPAGVPIKAPGNQGTAAWTPHMESGPLDAVVPAEPGTDWKDRDDGFDG